MDELMEKIQVLVAASGRQGMAYQRLLDAQEDFNEEAVVVTSLFEEVTAILTPSEEEKVQ